MRILFVTTCYPTEDMPQYCVFLEQQALALKRLGHAVDVLRIFDNGTIKENNGIFHSVPIFTQSISQGTSLDLIFPRRLSSEDEKAILKVLNRKYDVVSFHFGGMKLYKTIQKMCAQLHIPFIMHFHGLNIWMNRFEKYPALAAIQCLQKRHLYRKLNAAVFVSKKVEDVFKSKISTVPGFVVYNGVDADRFQQSINRKFFKNNCIRVLCVANLIPIKGQKYLIEAAGTLKNKGYHIMLTFAGRGPDEEALKTFAQNQNIDVDFAGYLEYDEIAVLMKKHDLFIMPSFFEALGCVYLEAMSSGMLTIGVKGQGIAEIIVDGVNGFLIEPQSVDSIVDTVCRIVHTDAEKLIAIAEAGKKTSAAYSWDASAKSLEQAYHCVLERQEGI